MISREAAVITSPRVDLNGDESTQPPPPTFFAMQLRDYQSDAVDALFERLKSKAPPHDPLVVMPTGSGKSVVMAEVIRRARSDGARVAVMAHVKELVSQNHAALCSLVPELAPQAGIYSAGLGLRQHRADVLFAGIQSIARKPALLGHRHLVLVDEAHMVPHKGEGQYRKVLNAARDANPRLRVVGLTATPYRTSGGYLTQGDGHLFDSVAYECDIVSLIRDGWLCPLVPRQTSIEYDVSGVKRAGGDFAKGALAARIDELEDVTRAAVDEMVEGGRDRKSWLVFCSSIRQAHLVGDLLQERAVFNKVVTGETDRRARDRAVEEFKDGRLRCIVNVGVFTTGFDARRVDFLGVLRPTSSTALYVQIMGRGMRTHEEKPHGCLVYDYGGNVERHGPINRVEPRVYESAGDGDAPLKVCPKCKQECPAGVRVCPTCDHEFPPPKPKIDTRASSRDIVDTEPPKWKWVTDVRYSVHTKQKEDGESRTLRADYLGTFGVIASEWVCVEHEGFAGKKAQRWIDERLSDDGFPPLTCEAAVKMGEAGEFKRPWAIQVAKEGKYDRIVGYRWADESADE